jgi:AcrR family transcriptional regulator
MPEQVRKPTKGRPQPRGRPRATWKGEALRKAILDEASKLFIERGLGGTSMQDIAASLGLTRTAVYYYFRNKEQILESLTEDVPLSAGRLTGKLAAKRGSEPLEVLRGLVEQYAMLVLSQPAEFRVVDRNEANMPLRLRTASQAARRRVLTDFTGVIQRGIEKGAFRRVDARIAAFAIIGMCNWTAWWFKPGGRKTQAEASASLADLAVHSLKAPPRKGGAGASVQERLALLRADLERLGEMLSHRKTAA